MLKRLLCAIVPAKQCIGGGGTGVRRLVIVDPVTNCVEGLVSLSDVAAYLFL